jgi:hypothetical protein
MSEIIGLWRNANDNEIEKPRWVAIREANTYCPGIFSAGLNKKRRWPRLKDVMLQNQHSPATTSLFDRMTIFGHRALCSHILKSGKLLQTGTAEQRAKKPRTKRPAGC